MTGDMLLRPNLASTAGGYGANLVAFLNPATGAVARTVQQKLQEQTSVADFGAVGDGVANDLTALNNAASSGSTVRLGKGKYKTSAANAATSGAWILDPQTRFTGPGVFNSQKGFYDDVKPGHIWRFPDRARFGAAAGSVGALNWYAPNTYLLAQFGWQERDAALYAMSNGRLAISGVSRSSLNTGPFLGFVGTASISVNMMTVTAITSGGVTTGLNLSGTGVREVPRSRDLERARAVLAPIPFRHLRLFPARPLPARNPNSSTGRSA